MIFALTDQALKNKMYILLVFVLCLNLFLYLQVFEHSVASMGPEGRNEAGRFLQVLLLSKSNFAKIKIRKTTNVRSVDSNLNLTCEDLVLSGWFWLR